MCFLIKKCLNVDKKKSYLFDRLFVSDRNLTTEHVKNSRFFQIFFNFSNPRFLMPKLSNSRFFKVSR